METQPAFFISCGVSDSEKATPRLRLARRACASRAALFNAIRPTFYLGYAALFNATNRRFFSLAAGRSQKVTRCLTQLNRLLGEALRSRCIRKPAFGGATALYKYTGFGGFLSFIFYALYFPERLQPRLLALAAVNEKKTKALTSLLTLAEKSKASTSRFLP